MMYDSSFYFNFVVKYVLYIHTYYWNSNSTCHFLNDIHTVRTYRYTSSKLVSNEWRQFFSITTTLVRHHTVTTVDKQTNKIQQRTNHFLNWYMNITVERYGVPVVMILIVSFFILLFDWIMHKKYPYELNYVRTTVR